MLEGRTLPIVLSCLVLLLVLVDILLMMGNQSVQTEVSDRQQFISQAIQIDNLNRQVVGAMANMALKSNDEQLKKLLLANGIDIDATGGTAPRSK
jgi:predicted Holliday junction resolvase-like endonuclease